MEQNIAESPVLFNAWTWAEKNKKLLIYAAIGLGVVGCVIYYQTQAHSEKLAAAGKELSQTIFTQMGRPDHAATAEALLKVAGNHPGTPAGAQALLLGAGNLFTAGKFAEAQAAYERFRKEYPGDTLMAQAVYGAGAALAAQAKWEEAGRAFKEVVDQHAKAPVARQAKYALAHAYEAQGKPEQALPLYQDILRDGFGGAVANESAQRAEALAASIKLPITPSPMVAATNAAPAKP